jgi:hypothetical protein
MFAADEENFGNILSSNHFNHPNQRNHQPAI